MTKFLKSFLSIALCVVLLVPLASTAFAVTGEGTSANPYVITTAEELQNINNNLSAYYVLGNNIDLSSITDFTPIGNSVDGTFTGSFNGDGFKISNLNVYDGKYAGLFGVNEGTIENVVLENVTVYGTRFVAGLCGYNAETGVIKSSSVTSGEVSSDGSVIDTYVAGIVAMNNGELQGAFSNGADVILDNEMETPAYVGGVIGYNSNDMTISGSCNTGSISSSESYYSYSGGLIGYSNGTVIISGSCNMGSISSSSKNASYSGGLIGWSSSTVTISGSCNTGNIYTDKEFYCDYYFIGGLVGYGNTINVLQSYNEGNISLDKDFRDGYYPRIEMGGLIGCGYGCISINKSFNAGNVCAYHHYGTSDVGGLVGKHEDKLTICESYNTGNLKSSRYTGGLVGISNYGYIQTIIESYNAGVALDGIAGSDYNCKNVVALLGASDSNDGCTVLTEEEMKNKDNFENWDFSNVWTIDPSVNSGFPTLKNTVSPLALSESVKHMQVGDSIQLKVYKNGSLTSDVTWSTSDPTVAVVSVNGFVTACSRGSATITARDSSGNKATFNVYSYIPADSIILDDRIVNIYEDYVNSYGYNYINWGSGDYTVSIVSDNTDVVEVDEHFDLLPKSVGTANITLTARGGATTTFKVTVVNTALSLSIPYSITVARDSDKTISVTTTPTVTSTPITWTSSDESVATVSENGVVHGVSIGSAVITARTDNGLEDTCTVTVDAPTKSIAIINNKITLQKGMTDYVKVVTDPVDTTSSISYSSSNSNVTVDSTGLITAKYVGTSTITVTSNGQIASCTVTVVDVPVILTDLTLDKSDETMNIGESLAITPTLTPTNATQKNITWDSTDETVASVNYNGVVTAKGAGKTIITATAENGLVAYCQITVNGVPSADISKIYIPDLISTGAEYVDVPVMIENNPGVNFAHLRVLFDETSLEPLSVTNGTVFDSVLGSLDENGVVKLCFTSQANKTANGVLATIRFKVLDATGSKEIKLCYFPSEIKNDKAEEVSMNLYDSVLTYDSSCVHTNTKIINAVSATCESYGYTGDTYCSDCGALICKGQSIPSIEHTLCVDIDEPTPGNSGSRTVFCTVCGQILSVDWLIWVNDYMSAVQSDDILVSDDGVITIDASACKDISEFLVATNGCTLKTVTSTSNEFLGTGSKVQVLDDNGVQVDEYTLVVRGDVNGDSVCDVIDCMLIELARTSNRNLDGVYLSAGDLAENGVIDDDDFNAIVNKVVA